MTNKYEPELGQAAFGAKFSDLECPEYIEALIRYLADEISRVEWNRTQKKYEPPTYNNGKEYKTDCFEMRSYCWEDCDETSDCKCCKPNFKCGDFDVRWYKYLGRGMSMNRDIKSDEAIALFDKCLKSVRRLDVREYP